MIRQTTPMIIAAVTAGYRSTINVLIRHVGKRPTMAEISPAKTVVGKPTNHERRRDMVVVIASCATVDDYDVVHMAIPMAPARARELLNLMDTIQALKATNASIWRLSAWDDSIK